MKVWPKGKKNLSEVSFQLHIYYLQPQNRLSTSAVYSISSNKLTVNMKCFFIFHGYDQGDDDGRCAIVDWCLGN